MSGDSDLDDALDLLREVGDGGVEFARLYERHARAILRVVSPPVIDGLASLEGQTVTVFGGLRESGPA